MKNKTLDALNANLEKHKDAILLSSEGKSTQYFFSGTKGNASDNDVVGPDPYDD